MSPSAALEAWMMFGQPLEEERQPLEELAIALNP
jgi:hypothetical protein